MLVTGQKTHGVIVGKEEKLGQCDGGGTAMGDTVRSELLSTSFF